MEAYEPEGLRNAAYFLTITERARRFGALPGIAYGLIGVLAYSVALSLGSPSERSQSPPDQVLGLLASVLVVAAGVWFLSRRRPVVLTAAGILELVLAGLIIPDLLPAPGYVGDRPGPLAFVGTGLLVAFGLYSIWISLKMQRAADRVEPSDSIHWLEKTRSSVQFASLADSSDLVKLVLAGEGTYIGKLLPAIGVFFKVPRGPVLVESNERFQIEPCPTDLPGGSDLVTLTFGGLVDGRGTVDPQSRARLAVWKSGQKTPSLPN